MIYDMMALGLDSHSGKAQSCQVREREQEGCVFLIFLLLFIFESNANNQFSISFQFSV